MSLTLCQALSDLYLWALRSLELNRGKYGTGLVTADTRVIAAVPPGGCDPPGVWLHRGDGGTPVVLAPALAAL